MSEDPLEDIARKKRWPHEWDSASELLRRMCESNPSLYEQILDSEMAYDFNQLCLLAGKAGIVTTKPS